jgi:hypothetical protein
MAFPFVFQSGFENRTTPFGWDAETDSGEQLDVPHASELARFPWPDCAPYRGGSCLRLRLGAVTTTAFLTEGDIDIADAGTAYFRWYFYLAPDFTFTADDVVSMLKLRQAGGGTVEYTIGLDLDADDGSITFGGSDGTAAAAFGATLLQRGRWYCAEVLATVSTNDAGVLTTWIDGVQQTTADTLDQAAGVGEGDLGIMDKAATTTGTVLMDEFVMDNARLYPLVDRYPESLELTQSAQVFIGAGALDNVSLLSGSGTDSVCVVYDTAYGDTQDAAKYVVELKNTAVNELVDPAGTTVSVTRGCYVALSGAVPRALVKIKHAPGYSSAGAVRRAALRSRPAVGEGL